MLAKTFSAPRFPAQKGYPVTNPEGTRLSNASIVPLERAVHVTVHAEYLVLRWQESCGRVGCLLLAL